MKNRLLKYLIYLINRTPEEFKDGADGVTLNVNGMLITGNMVPRKYYYEADQNKAIYNLIKNDEDEAEEIDQNGNVDVEAEVDKITLIHLTDAFYMMGSQRVPSSGGMYICVNIDSIGAYSMGALNQG